MNLLTQFLLEYEPYDFHHALHSSLLIPMPNTIVSKDEPRKAYQVSIKKGARKIVIRIIVQMEFPVSRFFDIIFLEVIVY
jgi:hypothetical protein